MGLVEELIAELRRCGELTAAAEAAARAAADGAPPVPPTPED